MRRHVKLQKHMIPPLVALDVGFEISQAQLCSFDLISELCLYLGVHKFGYDLTCLLTQFHTFSYYVKLES